MTKLLDEAVESARRLSPAMQDDLARVMLSFVREEALPVPLTPEEDEALAPGDRLRCQSKATGAT
jgi:hypothetical protein